MELIAILPLMASEDIINNDEILSRHISSVEDIFGSPPQTAITLAGGAENDTVFKIPEDTPQPPTTPTEPMDLAIPDGDGFLETERLLYERALLVYDQILNTGNEKLRLQAAKDIVSIYTGRRDTAIKAASTGNKETTNNHLHITVDSVKSALSSALHGMQGGVETTQLQGGDDANDNDNDKARPFTPFNGGKA